MLIACKCYNLVAATSSDFVESDVKAAADQQDFSKINDVVSQKFKESSRVYEECLDFFRQSSTTTSLKDLQENIVQTDLMYKVPIDPWLLYYCINCNTITHAKHTSDLIYLINSTLLTNQEELNSLKNHKSFSETFGILIMDHHSPITNNKNNDELSSSTSSFNTTFNFDKPKQNRFKKLTEVFNKCLQKEIYETDERIRRFTEQQFALLKSYREKSEQEYQILVSLINQVPDELKVIDAIIDNSLTKSIMNKAATVGPREKLNNTTTSTPSSLFTLKQQNILNLDTPPATPDSTPMSIGNSPTFSRQQQQTTNTFGGGGGNNGLSGKIATAKAHLIGNANNFGVETSDADCLFEIEGMEFAGASDLSMINAEMSDVEEIEDAEDAIGELDLGVQIPRKNSKKSNLNIAKSLPISISTIPESKFYVNELEDDISDDSNVDIAASIKALAKSVHGDTIFGDLPRPRFSTQI